MTFPETLKKRWYVLIAIPGIIIFLIYFGLVFMIHDPVSTIFIYELNSSAIPEENSISLTEEDFKVFPKLAPVIRDKTQKAVEIMDDGRLLYKISLFEEDERYTFTIRYGSSGFFEYKGKYYSYGLMLN